MHVSEVESFQDLVRCEGVQRGLRMPKYTPGPLVLDRQASAAAFYRNCLRTHSAASS